jgi:hypothetical protein
MECGFMGTFTVLSGNCFLYPLLLVPARVPLIVGTSRAVLLAIMSSRMDYSVVKDLVDRSACVRSVTSLLQPRYLSKGLCSLLNRLTGVFSDA